MSCGDVSHFLVNAMLICPRFREDAKLSGRVAPGIKTWNLATKAIVSTGCSRLFLLSSVPGFPRLFSSLSTFSRLDSLWERDSSAMLSLLHCFFCQPKRLSKNLFRRRAPFATRSRQCNDDESMTTKTTRSRRPPLTRSCKCLKTTTISLQEEVTLETTTSFGE